LELIKFLEENLGENLLYIGLSNDFLNMIQATKEKADKKDYIKLKVFFMANRVKRQCIK
jgi:hypothetical protein